VAKQLTQKERSFRKALLQQLITLSSTGFGLAAALSWNEAIQTFFNSYVRILFPDSYGVLSKLLYAILITCIAVLITYQLSRLASRFNSR
jgi:uncharacterized membrane protein YjjP (DUF1212 family)